MSRKEWCWVFVAIALVVGGGMYLVRNSHFGEKPVTAEEAAVAADRLLADKLSGPRYFSASDAEINQDGGPWIEITEALRQLPSVAAERGVAAEKQEELKRMILRLAESNPSRAIGGSRINLNQLNLTLDSSFK